MHDKVCGEATEHICHTAIEKKTYKRQNVRRSIKEKTQRKEKSAVKRKPSPSQPMRIQTDRHTTTTTTHVNKGTYSPL